MSNTLSGEDLETEIRIYNREIEAFYNSIEKWVVWHNKVFNFVWAYIENISHIAQNVQNYHFPELGVLCGHIHDGPPTSLLHI